MDGTAAATVDKDANMETGAGGCEFMRILEGSAHQTQEGLPKNADVAHFSVNMEVGGGVTEPVPFGGNNRPVHTSNPKKTKPASIGTNFDSHLPQVPQEKNPAVEPMNLSSGSLSVFGSARDKAGTSVASGLAEGFRPEYNTIRAARANSRIEKTLGEVGDIKREKPRQVQCGSFVVQDDERSGLVRNFHIPALKRNTSASVHREQAGGNLLCTSCIEKHQLDGTAPICIVLADQNFPPTLPTSEGLCTVILRIEDAILGELPDLLTEYFGKGRASVIPENSLVLFGSIAHLAQRGISN